MSDPLACLGVQSTANVASTILEDVKKSSESMDQTVSGCLDDFSGYLNHQGDVLKQELGSHFTSIQTFLSSQVEDVDGIMEQNGNFLEHSQGNVLHPTGSTPEKKPKKPLREIRSSPSLPPPSLPHLISWSAPPEITI
jgi:hypothetical protein